MISTVPILAGLPEAARAPRSFRRTPDSTARMAAKRLSILDGILTDLLAARRISAKFRMKPTRRAGADCAGLTSALESRRTNASKDRPCRPAFQACC